MQFSYLLSASLALLSSVTLVSTAPTESNIVERQLGGGPGDSEPGTSWSTTWRDTQLKVPAEFRSVRGSGCSYEVTFKRDARDTKYRLAYYSIFGEGEIQRQELQKPINLQWRGNTDGEGRRIYYGLIQSACSTFYTDHRPPRAFKVYFTESKQSKTNYIAPIFRA